MRTQQQLSNKLTRSVQLDCDRNVTMHQLEEGKTVAVVKDMIDANYCSELLQFIEEEGDMSYDKTWFNQRGFTECLNLLFERIVDQLPYLNAVNKQDLQNNAFVVKYDSSNLEHLDRHIDDSDLTLNICLGKSEEAVGGQVVFYGQNGEELAIDHQVGQCVIHSGDIRHEPQSMSQGSRVNLVVWYRYNKRDLPELEEHCNGAQDTKVIVKMLSGGSLEVFANLNWTVAELKQAVAKMTGHPADTQRYIFAGKRLCDEVKLKDYGITQNSTVHLVLRLRGGYFIIS